MLYGMFNKRTSEFRYMFGELRDYGKVYAICSFCRNFVHILNSLFFKFSQLMKFIIEFYFPVCYNTLRLDMGKGSVMGLTCHVN